MIRLPHWTAICSLAFALLLASCSGNGTAADHAKDGGSAAAQAPIVAEEVTYEADSIAMQGFLAYRDDGKVKPGILVVHEWWGHNEHARNAARKLADAGFVAMAVDMYGSGKNAAHPAEAAAFSGAVMSNMDGANERFSAAMAVLQQQEQVASDEIGAIGYCFGGGVVLNMARQGLPLDAVVSFHGSLGAAAPADSGAVNGSLLVLNGADDPFVPQEAIDAFKAEMQAAGVTYTFVNMPGAVHAFTNPEATALGERFELPLAYNAVADSTSWAMALAFLHEQLP